MIKTLYPKTKIEYANTIDDKRNYKVLSTKAKNILNFTPKVSIKDGLLDLVKFTKKNKIKNLKKKIFQNILNADKF